MYFLINETVLYEMPINFENISSNIAIIRYEPHNLD